MLTKKELLPNGIPPSETTQKNLAIRLTPKGHQDHYQDFPPEVSNPN